MATALAAMAPTDSTTRTRPAALGGRRPALTVAPTPVPADQLAPIDGHVPTEGDVPRAVRPKTVPELPTSTTVPPLPGRHTRPPETTLRGKRSSAAGVTTSYCWEMGSGPRFCACSPGWADPDATVVADPGEELRLSFDRADAPRRAVVGMDDRYDGDFDPARELRADDLRVDAPQKPGTYWIHLGTWWPEGDVSQVFKLAVRGAHRHDAAGSVVGRYDGDPDRTSVALTHEDGSTHEAVTNSANRFRFDDIRPGRYTIAYSVQITGENGETIGRSELRNFELQPGHVHREDFHADGSR